MTVMNSQETKDVELCLEANHNDGLDLQDKMTICYSPVTSRAGRNHIVVTGLFWKLLQLGHLGHGCNDRPSCETTCRLRVVTDVFLLGELHLDCDRGSLISCYSSDCFLFLLVVTRDRV